MAQQNCHLPGEQKYTFFHAKKKIGLWWMQLIAQQHRREEFLKELKVQWANKLSSYFWYSLLLVTLKYKHIEMLSSSFNFLRRNVQRTCTRSVTNTIYLKGITWSCVIIIVLFKWTYLSRYSKPDHSGRHNGSNVTLWKHSTW